MYDLAPELLLAVFIPMGNTTLTTVVETHVLRTVTIEELAFLANRSLSSFKRDFQKQYVIPPQRYILDRRLEMAWVELAKGKSVGGLRPTNEKGEEVGVP